MNIHSRCICMYVCILCISMIVYKYVCTCMYVSYVCIYLCMFVNIYEYMYA